VRLLPQLGDRRLEAIDIPILEWTGFLCADQIAVAARIREVTATPKAGCAEKLPAKPYKNWGGAPLYLAFGEHHSLADHGQQFRTIVKGKSQNFSGEVPAASMKGGKAHS
jgi:hypothetical protein